eukprot:COSAG03_NODE_23927_length_276_cov_0.576271_1_plen_58_part_01
MRKPVHVRVGSINTKFKPETDVPGFIKDLFPAAVITVRLIASAAVGEIITDAHGHGTW